MKREILNAQAVKYIIALSFLDGVIATLCVFLLYTQHWFLAIVSLCISILVLIYILALFQFAEKEKTLKEISK